jgi:hypothetical protein
MYVYIYKLLIFYINVPAFVVIRYWDQLDLISIFELLVVFGASVPIMVNCSLSCPESTTFLHSSKETWIRIFRLAVIRPFEKRVWENSEAVTWFDVKLETSAFAFGKFLIPAIIRILVLIST